MFRGVHWRRGRITSFPVDFHKRVRHNLTSFLGGNFIENLFEFCNNGQVRQRVVVRGPVAIGVRVLPLKSKHFVTCFSLLQLVGGPIQDAFTLPKFSLFQGSDIRSCDNFMTD